MKKYIKAINICILALIITFIFSNINMSYAKENSTVWELPEKTQEFQHWESLSEEEKENTVMPEFSSRTFEDSVKRSRYNILTEKKANLETQYQRPAITIKDQKQTGNCWAFSFSSVLEGTGKGKVYSPYYLNYVVSTIYNKTITNGGNFRLAMAASSTGKYPVLETKMPTDTIYNETTNSASDDYMIPLDKLPEGALNQTIDARITNATYFPGIYKKNNSTGNIDYSDGNGNSYTTDQVQALRTIIKEHIRNKGPVCADFYEELEKSYNANTGAYCYKGDVTLSNHDITIVGWDDNYAVSNFKEEYRPQNPGAYIALNSQGDTIGKNGYLYISYEDMLIENSVYGIDSIEEYANKDEIPYDTIYQYDELGYSYSVGGTNISKLMAANVFSRDNSKVEYINEVGVYIANTTGIQVYVNGDNGDKTQLKQVAVEIDNIEPGYHIIKLANPVKLTGDKFAVAVKYINKEMSAKIPLEANLKDSGIVNFSNFLDKAKANEGESFVSLDEGASWLDINGLKISDTITLRNTNACIKAYATTSNEPVTTPVTGVSLDKTSTRVKVGETDVLIAMVLPENATNKNVVWTSENEEIATVENGVVTGVREGNTTITVTTQDGNYVARCDVVIDKKEEPIIINVTGVELDKKEITVKVGETQTLTATVLPENATNKNIVWTSIDEEVATVENGVVTGIGEGNTTIKVTTRDGNHTSICNIEVTKETSEPAKVNVTGVTLNKKNLTLEVGDTGNLVATIAPKDATQKQVKWESSNEKVATITENGIIKAVSEGKTTIKVTTLDGNFTATCELTVTKKKNTADDIYKEDDNKPSNGDNGTTNDKNIINGDNTVANIKIPYAGNNTVLLVGIMIGVVIMVVGFIKIRKLRDVK